jgi:L-asparaginase II
MNNPVLVEVTRGEHVESRHRGAVVVVDSRGAIVWQIGDVTRPVFPRSAVKALQALPLVASGAAEKYGLTGAEIALACASHSGEPEHAATAAGLLAKLGRDSGCLECGSHWPMDQKAARELAAAGGEPSALHNNCSGKHSGFVCLACAMDVDPAGYVRPDHKVQEIVRRSLSEMTGAAHSAENHGIDGCSIPSYPVPLTALALGFARFGTGTDMPSDFAVAASRIRAAVAENPFMVAGTGRLDTRLMEALGTRVFMKTGAEGVYCAAFPELGYGVALKCDDGTGRASEVIMASIIARFLPLDGDEAGLVDDARSPVLKNWNGIAVGRLRPSADLLPAGKG